MSIHPQITKHVTIIALLSGVAVAAFGLFITTMTVFGFKVELTQLISAFILCLSVPLLYIVKIVERISERVDAIDLAGKTPPTVTYQDPDSLFRALLKHTRNGDSIYAHMLSEPPANLGKCIEDYFRIIDKKLKSKNAPYRVFRRIATVGSSEKAQWVIDSLFDLRNIGGFSLAVQYIEETRPQTSFHVVSGETENIVFVWVTVTSGGFGKAFSVIDSEIADTMATEHTREFDKSRPLKTGNELHWDEIDRLAEKYELSTYSNYLKLKEIQA